MLLLIDKRTLNLTKLWQITLKMCQSKSVNLLVVLSLLLFLYLICKSKYHTQLHMYLDRYTHGWTNTYKIKL